MLMAWATVAITMAVITRTIVVTTITEGTILITETATITIGGGEFRGLTNPSG